ncbi:alpha/beta-hydrolase [Aspergillus violaceofuscus CBS 115571]|uniref:Alpha/beta-hydrolase n=1 Tax=Aspergillus violaceofuscus (strain CBS 115571) TaxID=1450538 RepID=A0A2V5GW54_ASPV1|nr:alpha/beta-hydrolase [Aspergillus violaceofuscus CBS 115571]
MAKPTLIFAPGAWYPPTAFDPVIEKLPGYRCHTVAFPSIQQATAVQDLHSDINAVRSLVQQEADEGHDIIVVSHSWSGLPVNSALDGLGQAEREAAGRSGGVIKLVFLAAFLPEVGQSLLGAFGGQAPEWYIHDEIANTITVREPAQVLFHDVPDGGSWAQSLRPHAYVTHTTPATSAAYLHIPCSYLLCEEDRAIPLFVQEMMVESARAKGAQFEIEKVKTAHTPWLANPDMVAAYLRRQAGEIA